MKSKNENQTNTEKVDLSTVNKVTAKSDKITLPSLAKKQKGLNRDEEGKFAANTGRGGLKSISKINWKRALPLVVVVALVGGALVYKSFARSPGVSQSDAAAGILKRVKASQMFPRNSRGQTGLISGTVRGRIKLKYVLLLISRCL